MPRQLTKRLLQGIANSNRAMAEIGHMERLNAALFYAAVVLLVWLVFLIVRPFLVPLAWGAVLAVMFYPAHRWLAERWGATRAALASTAGVTVILIVPAVLLLVLVVQESVQAAQEVQGLVAGGRLTWVDRLWTWLAARIGEGNTDLAALVQDAARRVGTFLAARLGDVLRNVIVFVFELFLTLFALFYFLRDGRAIPGALRRLLPFEQKLSEQMLADAYQLIHASVTVSLLIAGLQGLLGGIIFAALGITAPAFWGTVMAFLSLLPLVGSWLVWLPVAIWLLVTGQTVRGIVLLAIGAGVIGMVDNILRPLLLSGRARLNGLLVFVSVLGGIGAFGMIGLILGPIVFAMAFAVLDVYAQQPQAR
jgi:predicted PurR-regulated permease PerM